MGLAEVNGVDGIGCISWDSSISGRRFSFTAGLFFYNNGENQNFICIYCSITAACVSSFCMDSSIGLMLAGMGAKPDAAGTRSI